jgi:hypothetical protein
LPYIKQDLELHSESSDIQLKGGMTRVTEYVNQVQSCNLIGNTFKGFSHECVSKRGHVVVKSDQELRFLRHKEGCRTLRCSMAYCPKCEKEWTSDELALCHVVTKKRKSVPLYGSVVTDQSVTKMGFATVMREKNRLGKRFLSEVIYQSKFPSSKMEVADEVNVNYNVHSTSHVRTCFRQNGPECRYRFPKRSKKRTRIEIPDEEQDWFSIRGVCCKRRIVEIVPQRGKFDVCMNNYCPIVSETKLACNSNVSVIVNGVQAFYISKYASKDTQEEDTGEYEPMIRYVKERLLNTKFPDSNVSESMSRVIGACLAHNSKNVISATMAKFLINNTSRFGMSHTIYYVPLYQMKRILDSEQIMLKISRTAVPGADGPTIRHFIEGSSLHYLYRPNKLERISFLDLIVKYDVRRKKQGDDPEDILCFMDGHPGQEFQHIVERTTSVIPGIVNWEFVDTARFAGDLLDPDITTDPQAEDYCKTVLILCHPFRTKEDLMYEGSYVAKFRLLSKEIIDSYGVLLQNIQDIHNAIRCKRGRDELEKETEAFKGETNADDSENEEELDENERRYLEGLFANMTTFETIPENGYVIPNDSIPSLKIPSNLTLLELQNKGAHQCGYQNLCDFKYTGDDPVVVEVEEPEVREDSYQSTEKERYPKMSVQSLYRVLITTVRRKIDTAGHTSVPENGYVNIDESVNSEISQVEFKIEATGTVESMNLRAEQAHFDKDQRKSFLMMLSHFILTYIEEVEEHSVDSTLSNTSHYSTI